MGLAVAAVAAAVGGQRLIQSAPLASLGAFAGAGVLMFLLGRRRPAPPEPETTAPLRFGAAFLAVAGVGTAVCGIAGVLVFDRRPAAATHAVWAAGLLILAGAALAGHRAQTPRKDKAPVLVLGLLALAAAIVFGWELTAFPAEVHGDDAEVGLDAVRLLGDWDLFRSGWFELPRFHALPTAIGLKLFGIDLFGLRVTSAALGVGSVLLLYAIVRRLWNGEAALIAAVLLIAQRFFIHLSRAGFHYIDTPFLSLLVLWLFLRLWYDCRPGAAVWCGIALGLGIQTYYASRLVPPLLALTWAAWMGDTPREHRRGRLAAFVLLVVVALAVAAPMFGYFAHDWDSFWARTRNTSVFDAGARRHLAASYKTENLADIIRIQLGKALPLFNVEGDTSVQYGLGPLFEPLGAALFVLGVALALARWRERRTRLVLLWTALPFFFGVVLTIDTPFFPRISGLVPFAVLLVALALEALLGAVRAALPQRSGSRLAAAIGTGVVVLIAAGNLRTYFVDHATQHRHSPAVEIAAWVRAHGAGKTTYMVGSAPRFYIRHGTIAFLAHGYATRDVENVDAFLRAQRPAPSTSLFIAMPHGVEQLPRLQEVVGPLRIEQHHARDGSVAFITAVPASSDDVAAEPPGGFDQLRETPPRLAAFGRWLDAIEYGACALIAAAGAAVLGLALAGRPRQQVRRPAEQATEER